MEKSKTFLYVSGKTNGQKLTDIKNAGHLDEGGKYFTTVVFAKETGKIYNRGESFGLSKDDLGEYMKTKDADSKYMPKSGSTGGSNSTGGSGGANLSISNAGSFNNYGNSGQAFNAVRDVSTQNTYNTAIGSGFPLNAASFGVKAEGTTAFSHKKYTTFDKDTGSYTGAKNTAVLVFSGKSGLLYAKNTGSGNDVSNDMYKYVGVINSPDNNQNVYSAAQVDAIVSTANDTNSRASENIDAQINALETRIDDLENINRQLNNKLELIIQKLNIEFTDEELEQIEGSGSIQPFSFNEIQMLQEEKRMMYEELDEEIKQSAINAAPPVFENNPDSVEEIV